MLSALFSSFLESYIVSRAWEQPFMDDPLEGFDDSSSTHSNNPSVHANIDSNTLCATNMTWYLNLNDPNNPFCLDNGDNPIVISVIDLLTFDNYATWSRAMRWAFELWTNWVSSLALSLNPLT